MNQLHYGDNLKVMRNDLPSESVDLIYLDPPFNSQAGYNVIFRDQSGQESGAQILAFNDTWTWGPESDQAIEDLMISNGELARFLQQFVSFLGKNSLSSYLTMMAVRLVEMHRILKPTGSLYLHCDPTASHYLKIILDTIFGPKNFRNEIIWQRTNVHSDSRTWSRVSDTILFYTVSDQFTWNPQFLPHDPEYVKAKYSSCDEDGHRYTLSDMTSPSPRPNMMYEWQGHASPPNGWRYSRETMQKLHDEGRIWYPEDKSRRPRRKRYLSEMQGTLLGNVWTDIPPLNSQAMERMGYPTQKPVALLERIIQASSNPGDVVMDPFCGCGTTISAAQKLGRQWIGIDITQLSVSLIKARLKRDFDLLPQKDYEEHGNPVSVEDAQAFAAEDPFQFQFWIVGEIGAQVYGAVGDSKKGKKGGDTGIDGRMFFRTPDGHSIETAIVSVKAGKNLNPGMIRDLRGTVEREKAAIGILLLAHEPTKGMLKEAAGAGAYTWEGRTYPKLQILTVADILNGKQPIVPRGAANVSYEQKEAKSTKRRGSKAGQPTLFAG